MFFFLFKFYFYNLLHLGTYACWSFTYLLWWMTFSMYFWIQFPRVSVVGSNVVLLFFFRLFVWGFFWDYNTVASFTSPPNFFQIHPYTSRWTMPMADMVKRAEKSPWDLNDTKVFYSEILHLVQQGYWHIVLWICYILSAFGTRVTLTS